MTLVLPYFSYFRTYLLDAVRRAAAPAGSGEGVGVLLSPPRRGAAGGVAGEERVRVGVLALPPAVRVGEVADGEVQVVVARAGVARVAHVGDHLAAPDGHPLAHAGGVALEMGVVVQRAPVRVQLV